MSEQEKKILESISKVLPSLPEAKKEWLLGFGEGIAFAKGQQAESSKDGGAA